MTNEESAAFTAYIASADGEGTEPVEIRTLDADRLAALRVEAGEAGDSEMVALIDRVLAD